MDDSYHALTYMYLWQSCFEKNIFYDKIDLLLFVLLFSTRKNYYLLLNFWLVNKLLK